MRLQCTNCRVIKRWPSGEAVSNDLQRPREGDSEETKTRAAVSEAGLTTGWASGTYTEHPGIVARDPRCPP